MEIIYYFPNTKTFETKKKKQKQQIRLRYVSKLSTLRNFLFNCKPV